MTYAELIQAMQDWVESNETAMVNNLDQIIEFGELRIYRTLDLPVQWTYATATVSTDDEFVTLPTGTRVVRSVQIVDQTTNDRTFLRQKDMSFVDEYVLDRDSTGSPRFYAWWDDATLMIAPSPSTNVTVEIAYTKRPTQLSGSNTTTWLSLNAPDVLLYSCLMELAIFLKEEPDIIQGYEKMFQQAYQGLGLEENIRNRTDVYETQEIRQGG